MKRAAYWPEGISSGFLGLATLDAPSFGATLSATIGARVAVPLEPAMRRRLEEFFAPWNARLRAWDGAPEAPWS